MGRDASEQTPSPTIDAVRARPGGRSARIRSQVLAATREALLADGYGALSHRAVAKSAGVDPATVYRRWPSRSRLAADALLEVAETAVPVPNTGAIESDLGEFFGALASALSDPGMLRLFHALSAARADAEADLSELLRAFWEARYERAQEMFVRAVDRGEIPPAADPRALVEQLVAPLYFRALVTGEALDSKLAQACITYTLAAACGPRP